MKVTLAGLALFGAMLAPAAHAANPHLKDGIAAFNQSLAAATRAMDNRAMLALWEDDGTSLLPDTPPIKGKTAIAQFLATVSEQLRGARMLQFDLACHEIQAGGDWASEWCDEHQVVALANGQPRFDGRGRMALVLHRDAGQVWRLRREMWQPTKAP